MSVLQFLLLLKVLAQITACGSSWIIVKILVWGFYERRSDGIFILHSVEVIMCIESGICSVTGVGTSGSESYNSQFVPRG